MRITLTRNATRHAFENVEMVIIDDKELCIWQPNVGNRRGSRRTRIDRKELKGIVYVETKPDEETQGTVDSQRT